MRAMDEDLADPCARCGQNPVWKSGHLGFTGKFCYACIDRCHEALEFDHICDVCRSEGE